MKYTAFYGTMVRVTDRRGKKYTGIAEKILPEDDFSACERETKALNINGFALAEEDILQIESQPAVTLLRATETWEKAGAYYVRIQAMARKHHISLRQEFDEHDAPHTKYIVVTEDEFPIATARMYALDAQSAMIGRVVVLPEYRRLGIGTLVVRACETWAEELGFSRTVVESRENKTEFYREMGYTVWGEAVDGETFRCIRMEKEL